MDPGGRLILQMDAKYKARDGGLAAIPMGDQYQQYAYAAATGIPTAFLYVESGSEQPVDSDWIRVGNEARPVAVALASVPFPRPGVVEEWRSVAQRSLEHLLEAVGGAEALRHKSYRSSGAPLSLRQRRPGPATAWAHEPGLTRVCAAHGVTET